MNDEQALECIRQAGLVLQLQASQYIVDEELALAATELLKAKFKEAKERG